MQFGQQAIYFGIVVTVLRFRPDCLGRYEVRFPNGGIDYAFPDDLDPTSGL